MILVNPHPVGVIGLGIGVPDRVLSNKDLEKIVDTTDEWIVSRSGIRERRILDDDQKPTTITTLAARRALEDSGLSPDQIDGVIVCTFTPESAMPTEATRVHLALGLKEGCYCADFNSACSGFVKGMLAAYGLVKSGVMKNVLLVGMDCNTRIVDYQDRTTCVLFGDGAGAVVISQTTEGRGILGMDYGSDSAGGKFLALDGGLGSYPYAMKEIPREERFVKMNGREVYKFAVRVFVETMARSLAQAGVEATELDLLVPHQANARIVDSARARFGLSEDRVVLNMDRYGNTSGASIPLALDTARQEGRLKEGDLIGLVAFGGGLTYGSIIMRW